jgi:hypothetical protein
MATDKEKIGKLKKIKQECKNRIAEFEEKERHEHLHHGDEMILMEERVRLMVLEEVDVD